MGGSVPADKHGLKVIQATLDTLLIGKLARLKHLVPDPTTLGQLALKNAPLAIGQIETVCVGRAHTLECSTRVRK